MTPARVTSLSDVANITGALSALQDVTVGVKMAGKVKDVYVREGDLVRAGQIIVQQDLADLNAQRDQSRASLEQAKANLVSAQTRLESAKVGYENAQSGLKLTDEQTGSAARQAQAVLDAAKEQTAVVKKGAREQELQQAQENVVAAKADRDKARADLKRYQDLYRQQAVSAQQLDQAQSITDSADARYNSAVQALSLLREGARPEDIRRAEAAVEEANQALITAQAARRQVAMRRDDVETARVGILTAQAGVRQAQAALSQAEAALRLTEQAIADASIRSPINGVVAERKVEPGVQAAPSRDVARIVALDSIYFDGQLSETQLSEVRIGQRVQVFVDAVPGRVFQGEVRKLFPVGSAAARSFTVRIGIKNEGNKLRPQMFARGEITLATHPAALVVPREAVLDFNGKTGRIFVAKGDKAEERPIVAGFSNLRQIEITKGAKPGEKVITLGQAELQSGDKIQIIPSPNAEPQPMAGAGQPKM